MALDQYYVNLNNQLAAGKKGESGGISDKEYTEKYMAYAYAQRVSRLEASEIGKESTLYNPTYLDSKSYQTIVNGKTESTQKASETVIKAAMPTPTINPINSTNQVVVDGAGNMIVDGKADTTTRSPIILIVIAFLLLIFID